MAKLIVLQGLPGSGKSRWVHENHPKAIPTTLFRGIRSSERPTVITSADHYFMTVLPSTAPTYVFNPADLGKAHAAAQVHAIEALAAGKVVIYDNTNTQAWEWSVVVAAAHALQCDVEFINIYDGGCTDEELVTRNAHGVPIEAISQMRAGYEHTVDVVGPQVQRF